MGADSLGRRAARDRALVRAIAQRDSNALGTLYDRYSSSVLALCIRILRDRSDAEEVLGDVFWELWNRPERFDASRANLLTYLITLARSRSLDRLRARRRKGEQSIEDRPITDPTSPNKPLESAILSERRERIRQAMELLNPDQRQAIELSFFAGLSHAEISTELAQPLGTVKSRIRNGLIQLRDRLRIAYGGGEIV